MPAYATPKAILSAETVAIKQPLFSGKTLDKALFIWINLKSVCANNSI